MLPAARHRLATLMLWLTPALWSSNYIIARLASGRVAPHQLALGRWSLAFLMMLPFAGAALWAHRAEVLREWRRYLVLGSLGMWVCGAFVYLGGQATSSTNIALIYAAAPVAIALIGTRLTGGHMSGLQRAGAAMALVGVLFVIAKGDPNTLLRVHFNRGDAWIAVASACWAAYSLLLVRWPSSLAPLPRLAAIALGGVVVLVPFTVMEALITPQPALGLPGLGLVVLAALMPGVLSYGAYSFMMRELGPAKSALALYLAPVYGAALAWLVLGEAPHWYHAAGAALILPSIYLATRQKR